MTIHLFHHDNLIHFNKQKRIAPGEKTSITVLYRAHVTLLILLLLLLLSLLLLLLLYGCESSTLNKHTQHIIEATEMWSLRNITIVYWTEKKITEHILRTTNCKRKMIITITTRQARFIGHRLTTEKKD